MQAAGDVSSGAEGLLFGLDALELRMHRVCEALDQKTLKDLGPVTDCMVFRWLLVKEKAQKLDAMAKRAYDRVLMATTASPSSGASPDHGSAMEHMVAAHVSQKAAKSLKQAASKASSSAPAAKKIKQYLLVSGSLRVAV